MSSSNKKAPLKRVIFLCYVPAFFGLIRLLIKFIYTLRRLVKMKIKVDSFWVNSLGTEKWNARHFDRLCGADRVFQERKVSN